MTRDLVAIPTIDSMTVLSDLDVGAQLASMKVEEMSPQEIGLALVERYRASVLETRPGANVVVMPSYNAEGEHVWTIMVLTNFWQERPDYYPPTTINRIDIKEFCDNGYLHEVNRLVLHPLGLAMEVVVEDQCACEHHFNDHAEDAGKCQVEGCVCEAFDGIQHLGGVWDYRDDPEGMVFGDDLLNRDDKARKVLDEWRARSPERMKALGYMVQPVPGLDQVAGYVTPVDSDERQD